MKKHITEVLVIFAAFLFICMGLFAHYANEREKEKDRIILNQNNELINAMTIIENRNNQIILYQRYVRMLDSILINKKPYKHEDKKNLH